MQRENCSWVCKQVGLLLWHYEILLLLISMYSPEGDDLFHWSASPQEIADTLFSSGSSENPTSLTAEK